MRILFRYILFVIPLMLTACSEEIEDGIDTELTTGEWNDVITLEIPGAPLSRSLANGDGVTPPASTQEKLCDGWGIKSLTMFYVCQVHKKVEAFRHILLDCSGTNPPAEQVTFDFRTDDPKNPDFVKCVPDNVVFDTSPKFDGNVYAKAGKNISPAKDGTYHMFAIANYWTHDDKYQDPGQTKLKDLLTNIAKKIYAGTDIYVTDVTDEQGVHHKMDTDWAALVSPDNDNISVRDISKLCPKDVHMVLYAADTQIKIKPGLNVRRTQLYRTRARMRIDVRNESGKQPITVNQLSFSKPNTVPSVPIFPVYHSDPHTSYTPKPATLISDITHEDAITRFVPGTEIQPNDKKTAFDGYFLGSKAPEGGYEMKIKVSASAHNRYVTGKPEASMSAGKMYLIKEKTSGMYLIYNEANHIVSLGESSSAEEDMLWLIDNPDRNNMGKIYPKKDTTKRWCINRGNNSEDISMIEETKELSARRHNLYWWKGIFTYDYYSIGPDMKWKSSKSEPNNNNPVFDFIPVTLQSDSPTKEVFIPFEKLVNGIPELNDAIRRNDFIRVTLNVRYNEKSGSFDFNISDWTDKDYDITFD